MYRAVVSVGILGLAGVGGYALYKKYYTDNDAAPEDDYWAGINFGVTGWSPQLPIHAKSKTPTQAVYNPITINHKKYGAGNSIPARNMDYYNPSQLVPSIGPGNLAPIPGVNTSFVQLNPFETSPRVVAIDPGATLTAGGPLKIKNPSGNFIESRSVIANG